MSPAPENLVAKEKYDKLLGWLRSQDAIVNDKIRIVPSPYGGFGAAVVEEVEEEELLFTVPRSACLTLKDAVTDSQCGEAFSKLIQKAGPGGNTVAMAGFMAKEYLAQKEKDENAAGDSKFGPYLATLPWERGVNSQEHALFWSGDDVGKYLEGTMCFDETDALRSEVDLAIRVINGITASSIRAARGEETEPTGFSWPWEVKQASPGLVDGIDGAVKGAFVSLLTRSFEDGDEDNGEKLVPLLDMLQHSKEPNVSHIMRKDDGTVEVRAKRKLAAGEELLNQYREEEEEKMPKHRFFSRFGFVPGSSVKDIPSMLEDPTSIFYPQKAEV
eukprot:CAMPEP_0113555224 /NCGR_PEP_ID=MMETSP0015_2-20120614/16592_1 /TAXON_ID=2838 /ORGANISM="Odontella" /LENGTH=329 /DNA_ID=CAMNT_0000456465 /DNA_START=93 /DNA_END=1082 /DNA_ORIENTATION=- /assembly_acc=CAM_ASM_000160